MLVHTGPSCNELQEEPQQLPDTSPPGGSQQGSGNGASSPQTQLVTSPHFSALINIKGFCLKWIFSTFSSSGGFLGQITSCNQNLAPASLNESWHRGPGTAVWITTPLTVEESQCPLHTRNLLSQNERVQSDTLNNSGSRSHSVPSWEVPFLHKAAVTDPKLTLLLQHKTKS